MISDVGSDTLASAPSEVALATADSRVRFDRNPAAGSPARNSRLVLKTLMIVMMFATMGASIAWVFERLSPDAPYSAGVDADPAP